MSYLMTSENGGSLKSDAPVIVSNNQFRPVIHGYDLTDKEALDFDYCEDIDSEMFVKYKGIIYHLSDILHINKDACLPLGFNQWDGYVSETFFSGVLFCLSDDCELVKCGRYYS